MAAATFVGDGSTDGSTPAHLFFQGDPACCEVQRTASPGQESASTHVEVPKVSYQDLSYDDFCSRFMSANLPVLIQGVAADWNITKRWVNPDGSPDLEAICKQASTSEVFVTDTRRELKGEGTCTTMTVSEYCQWWAAHKAGIGEAAGQLLYLKDWHFLNEHPEFQAHQLPQYFSDDWLNEYYDHLASKRAHCDGPGTTSSAAAEQETSPSTVTSDYRFVYLGPSGSTTPLHADVLRSYSWSANIAGRKRWKLLPPEHTWLLYNTTLTQLAPDFYLDGLPDVDPGRFPGLEAAQKLLIEVIQEPGEAIFVPACWHHTVENLEDTLSLNHNWFNAFGARAAWAFLKRQRELAEASISDCRELCSSEEEFQELVQKLLGSNAGLDLAAWVDLLGFVVRRDVRRLQEAPGLSDELPCANKWVLFSLETCGRLLHELLEDESARRALPVARRSGRAGMSRDGACVGGGVGAEQGPWQPGYVPVAAGLLRQAQAAVQGAGLSAL